MDSDSTLASLATLLSLFFFALVSVAESGTLAARRERVQRLMEQRVAGAGSLKLLLERQVSLHLVLGLFRLGAVIAVTLSVAALVISVTSPAWTYVSLSALGSLLLLAVTHSLLRQWGQRHGESLALRMAPVLRLSALPLAPVVMLVHRLAGPEGNGEMSGATFLDPLALGETLSLEQQVDVREARMIRAILRLEKTVARAIMVPRVDVVAVEVDTPVKEVAELMLERGHSRIPLFEETIDNVVGVIHARDLLRFLGRPEEVYDLRDIARPPLFIPDSKPLDELLREFQERRFQMAIVVDEYGGSAGVVSIEDLLEEIVGEIEDEFDIGEPEVEVINAQEAVMDARVSLEQVNELFASHLEGDGFDTLGGLVYSQLGKIPDPGDAVESDGLHIQVISTLGRRIKRVRVVRADTGQ